MLYYGLRGCERPPIPKRSRFFCVVNMARKLFAPTTTLSSTAYLSARALCGLTNRASVEEDPWP